MSTTFKGKYYTGLERGPLCLPYTPAASPTYGVNDLVTYDTTADTINICGADPVLILGWAQSTAAVGALLRTDGKTLVEVIDEGVEYGLPVNGTIADANVGSLYGLVKFAAGIWQVDLSETTVTSVKIVRADVENGIAFVHFVSAKLQTSTVVS